MKIINNDIIDTIIGLADQEIQSCYEVARRVADKDLKMQADSAANALAHATPLLKAAPDMLEILQTLKRRLPELDDDEAPLAGSEAVEVLCSIWSDLNITIAKAKGE